MKTQLKYAIIALAALVVASLVVCGGLVIPSAAAGTTYYVDCSAGSNGDGSQSSPFNSLAAINGVTLGPGDSALFKRGTTCHGQLKPVGSGASGSPITIGAYGSGARPIIDGDYAVAPVVSLNVQEYFVFQDLEIKESTGAGLRIWGGKGAALSYFRLTNLYVHHVDLHDGGFAIEVGRYNWRSINDAVIDNCVTHDAFRGIYIAGQCCNDPAKRGNDNVIRNSVAYNCENDGIILFNTNNALMENNVVYSSGLQPEVENHTPNALWTWDVGGAVVQFNEVYLMESPDADGGAYDIDYYCQDNIYQYNYAHDNYAFGIAVYGAERTGTINSVVRYNIFSNNGRVKSHEGDFYTLTWNRGWLDGMQIYNNTSYWNPVDLTGGCPDCYSAAFCVGCIAPWQWYTDFGGTRPNFFKNNIIISDWPYIIWSADPAVELDYNLYWYTGAGNPKFIWGPDQDSYAIYEGFSTYQAASGEDANSIYADPKVNNYTYHGVGMPTTQFTLQSDSPAINAGTDVCTGISGCTMGTRDFYGNAIPNGQYDIGAHEYGGAPPPTDTPGGPTDTPEPPPTDTPIPPTDTPPPGGTMHVGDITMGCAQQAVFHWATATVTILDASDQPVGTATVYGTFSGASSSSPSGDTAGDGTVSFDADKVKNGGTWTFTVDDVVKSGWTYDENANVETSDQITCP
jgi:hypothetical protein